ncbi:MAG: hypothetical protein OEO82_08090, partial [Gammaproteobacteria bacterium]|nr:hypothetical protein [Gammaproteobacteria bacterium]
MRTASQRRASAKRRMCATTCALLTLALCNLAVAAGTPAGTVIENTATVSFDLGGGPLSLDS